MSYSEILRKNDETVENSVNDGTKQYVNLDDIIFGKNVGTDNGRYHQCISKWGVERSKSDGSSSTRDFERSEPLKFDERRKYYVKDGWNNKHRNKFNKYKRWDKLKSQTHYVGWCHCYNDDLIIMFNEMNKCIKSYKVKSILPISFDEFCLFAYQNSTGYTV